MEMVLIAGVVATILASIAAANMCIRKNLSSGWAVGTFMLSPLFLLVWVLPFKDVEGEDKAARKSWTDRPVEWLGLVGMALVGLAIYMNPTAGYQVTGLPGCNSSVARASVNNALANAPAGRVYGINVVSMSSEQTVSSTRAVVQCRAVALLNNQRRTGVSYTFWFENGTVLVVAQLDSFG